MDSLRDGREVYFAGEGVSDVTMHPACRNSIHSTPDYKAAFSNTLGGFPGNAPSPHRPAIAINGVIVAEDAAGHTPAIVTITKQFPRG
jgi:hypothetical protein